MTKSEGDGRGGWGCEGKAVDREGGGCGGVRGERLMSGIRYREG